MTKGRVFNIQRYSLNDGPGIRTTVFLKGCPLCCAWCHNPESIKSSPEIVVVETRCIACGECRDECPLADCVDGQGPMPTRIPDCLLCGACVEACPTGARQMIGRELTVPEVMEEALADRVFYEQSGGGVTVSGGEPLAQPSFLLALLKACRDNRLHAALDTTGLGQTTDLIAAAGLADLVLYDLKAFDETLHVRLTGISNSRIIENLKVLDHHHRNVWIRLPLVPGFNDDLKDLRQIAALAAGLHNVTQVSLLPFHRAGVHKFQRLGVSHLLEHVEEPSAVLVESALAIFGDSGLRARVGS